MMSNDAIIVFLKQPVPGQVKTRIGNVTGHQKAVEIYQQLLDTTFRILAEVEAVKLRFFDPDPFEGDWPDQVVRDYRQRGANLGERMSNAFDQALADFSKVVIIGTDCPYLSATILKDAFLQLDHHDVVIGPSADGGYYLLGMTQAVPELFKNMPWSSDRVYDLSIEILQRLQKSFYLLPELSDVDFLEDWEAYLASQ